MAIVVKPIKRFSDFYLEVENLGNTAIFSGQIEVIGK